MIPYFELSVIHLGPIPIQVWGFFVSAGIVAALWFSSRDAGKVALSSNHIWNVGFGMVVAGFILARLVHVFGYFADVYLANPLEIFKIWQGGYSATGGLIGGLLYFVYYVRRHSLPFWNYLDVLAMGFPLGYAIGRIGCFLIHDHPGTLSNFILAVKYPDGARHDLGLDLSLSAFVMFLLILILKTRGAVNRQGFFTGIVFIWYGLTRFSLDFLRATDLPYSDPRHFGLTIAQYFGLILIAAGVAIIIKYDRKY